MPGSLLSRIKSIFNKSKNESESSSQYDFITREVYFNKQVEHHKHDSHTANYCTNRISTSQYNIINFIPLNLARQFKRAANLYFLFMTIIQVIPYFAIASPILAILPIAAVLAITAIKDGIEDWRRHINDKNINDRQINVVRNILNPNMLHNSHILSSKKKSLLERILPTKKSTTAPKEWLTEEYNAVVDGGPVIRKEFWSNIRVGDVLEIREGDAVPADMIIISTSSPEGICFTDTKDLDGETNLKPKSSMEGYESVRSIEDLCNVQFVVESDAPSVNMTVFNSKVTMTDVNTNTEKVSSANISNMLLRGMVVRNTDWALGIVIYTGVQTKVILNSGPPPFKRSRLEIMMNQQVISNFGVLAIMCIASAIAGGVMYTSFDRHRGHMLYLDGDINPVINGIRLCLSALILLQNVIPISLYVTIEFIKLMHAYFIYNDLQMFYEEKQIACIPRNWSISDDMGQVSYVFSDKTGTLTRNIMDFRMCSISGMVYGRQLPGDELDVVKSKVAQKAVTERNEDFELASEADSMDYSDRSFNADSTSDYGVDPVEKRRAMVAEYLTAMKNVFNPKYVHLGDQDTGETGAYTFVDPELFKHMNPRLANNLNPNGYAPWTTPEEQMESINLFMTQLAVCHTVLVEKDKKKTLDNPNTFNKHKKQKGFSLLKRSLKRSKPRNGSPENESDPSYKSTPPYLMSQASTVFSTEQIEQDKIPRYSAESPDEGSLVTAARNFGYAFLGRTKDIIQLDILGNHVEYKVLDVIEFNSTRKRMSIVVRRPAPYNDIVIFTKGADSIIINLLRVLDPSELKEISKRENTYRQIDEFANAGLRTLVLGYRVLSEEEYSSWSVKYKAAISNLTEERQNLIDSACCEIERDFELVGSTGIEDKLQERVPDCIASLRSAGIKVWVLTGDKMETAINIGFASNLLTKDMELWTLDGKKSENEIIDQFWLISRVVRQSAGIGEPSASAQDYKPADGVEMTSISYTTPQKIGLKKNEQTLLAKISYRVSRATKYVRTISRSKKQKEVPLKESQILNESINVLRRDRQAELNKKRFSTVAGERFSKVFQTEQTPARKSTMYNALVIDGKALTILLSDDTASKELVNLAPYLKSVICCRSSPLQKSQVVELIRYGHNAITLAIGDGANDVSMIQAANVGIAIAGEEGMQAANASDYTIGRFHYLQNLLLVHGLFNYLRVCEAILSFFYKNIIWAIAPFWFAFFCRFSGNMFYEIMYIQLYNLVFTVFPVIVIGTIDKPFNYKTAMLYTGTYRAGIENSYFSHKKLLSYVLDAAYQSAICFFVFYGFVALNATVQSKSGRVWSIYDMSSGIVIAIVTCASLTLGLNAWSWSWLMWASIAFSIGSFFTYNFVANFIPSSGIYQSFATQFNTSTFWLAFFLSVILALVPRFAYKVYQKSVRPTDIDVVREIKILHKPWYGQVTI